MRAKYVVLALVSTVGMICSATVSAQDSGSVEGSWKGYYECNHERTPVRFDILEKGDSTEVLMTYYPSGAGGKGDPGKYKMKVSTNSDGSIELSPDEWVLRPGGGHEMIGFKGSLQKGGKKFAGKIQGVDYCSDFATGRVGGAKAAKKAVEKSMEKVPEQRKKNREEGDIKDFEQVDDQGFHSDLHKKHAGEIVFSNESIPKEDHSGVDPETTFGLMDPVYHRSFFEKSMGNVMREAGFKCQGDERESNFGLKMQMHIQIGDAPKSEWLKVEKPLYFSLNEFNRWTSTPYFAHSLTGSSDIAADSDETRPLFNTMSTRVLSRLGPGEHELTFHAIAVCDRVKTEYGGWKNNIKKEMAKGTLTLKIDSEDQIRQFWKKHGPQLPEPAHSNDAVLSKRAEKRLDEKWSNEDVLDIVTTGSDWAVKRDRVTGEPVQRSVSAKALVQKKKTGECRLFDITLIEKYVGDGYSDDLTIASSRDYKYAPCAIHE